MSFNPQAVLGYSPTAYVVDLMLPPTGMRGPRKERFTADRKQTSGRYDTYGQCGPLIDDLAKTLGITPRARKYEQDDICRLLHAAGAKFEPNNRGLTPELCALFQAQVEALGSGNPPDPVWVQAKQEFDHIADLLLAKVQADVYPKFKLQSITNPLKARALANRREGVFLWPDWRDARYVNVVMSCEPGELVQVRDLVLDWCEANNLRLNPRFYF